MKTILLGDEHRGDPVLMQWFAEHGVDPHDVAARSGPGFNDLAVDDQGRVHCRRYLLDGNGHRCLDQARKECVTEPVVITPHRPFPIDV
jgi:hypothetical protein